MGRIGDGDVHAAYVEFRAKESDKVRHRLISSPSSPTLEIIPQRPLFFALHQHIPFLNSTSLFTLLTSLRASVFPHNASTASPSAPKIPPASDNTS